MDIDQLKDSVDTIVIVMMENRSFDHMLGFLSHEDFDARTDIEGLHKPSDDFSWDNPDTAGKLYPPTPCASGYLPCDLPHERDEIAAQLAGMEMTGFVEAYFAAQASDRSPVPMYYQRPTDVPVTAALARDNCVCDHWFASLPASTQPNRLMAMSGKSRIDVTTGIAPLTRWLPQQFTLLDWLDQKGLPFEIYGDGPGIPAVGHSSNFLLMPSQWGHLNAAGHGLGELAARWNDSSRPAPAVIYCEPMYNDLASALGSHGSCNHPPLPVTFGEDFLKRVYLALTSNPARWARTVLVIYYDEHGGFFDHVAPPAMPYHAPPDALWSEPNAPFTSLGVRVPAIVVSPLVDPASAYHELLDHTSLLQLVIDRFGDPSDLAAFGDAVARKQAGVKSVTDVLSGGTPRTTPCTMPTALPQVASVGAAPAGGSTEMFRDAIAEKRKTAPKV